VRADDSTALVIAGQSGPVDRAGTRTWVLSVVPLRASGANLSVVVLARSMASAQAQSVTTKVRPAGAVQTVRALSVAPAAAGGENLSLLPVEERSSDRHGWRKCSNCRSKCDRHGWRKCSNCRSKLLPGQ